jgi:DNA-binding transcriptional regulator YdaS (Cro superfamily)
MQISDVIAHYGSHAAVARALGIHPSAVYQWKQRRVPLLRQLQLEVLTGGQLRREILPIVDGPAGEAD